MNDDVTMLRARAKSLFARIREKRLSRVVPTPEDLQAYETEALQVLTEVERLARSLPYAGPGATIIKK